MKQTTKQTYCIECSTGNNEGDPILCKQCQDKDELQTLTPENVTEAIELVKYYGNNKMTENLTVISCTSNETNPVLWVSINGDEAYITGNRYSNAYEILVNKVLWNDNVQHGKQQYSRL